MKPGQTIFRILKNGCVIFTMITLIVYGIGAMLSSADKTFIPTFQWIVLFFVFSLLLSSANQILRTEHLSVFLRVLFHFLAAATLYIVAVVLCGGLYKNGTMLLLSLAVFIAGYILFAILVSVRMRRCRRSDSKKEPYKPVFH